MGGLARAAAAARASRSWSARSRSSASRRSRASSRRTRSSPRALADGWYGVRALRRRASIGAFLTGLYTFRMLFLVFGGEPSRVRARAPPRAARRHGDGPFSMTSTVSACSPCWRRRRLDPDRRPSGTDRRLARAGRRAARRADRAPGRVIAACSRRARARRDRRRLADLRRAPRRVPRYAAVQRVLEHKLYFDELYDASSTGPPSARHACCALVVERPLIAGSIDAVAGADAPRSAASVARAADRPRPHLRARDRRRRRRPRPRLRRRCR